MRPRTSPPGPPTTSSGSAQRWASRGSSVEGLELQGVEHDIPGKKLDVLAAVGVEADGETVGVAIDNQYGVSEHGRLGQLTTYVAGVSAAPDRVLGVWLVDAVHAAHEAAIELLTRETTERLGLVLARPRFIAVDTREFGVDFDAVVRPNEFVKREQRKARSGSPRRAEFLESPLEASSPARDNLGFPTISGPRAGYSVDIS